MLCRRMFAVLAATCLAVSAVHAGNVSTRTTIQPGPTTDRDFALTALQQLKGPAQRPFADLLNTLSPPAAQPGIVISTKATKNITCSAGVCTPTTAKAILNVGQLTNMLVDENVTIGTSAKAPDIRIEAPFSWTSAHGLTLQATGNIAVNR